MKTATFEYAKESKQNPYIGFTSFQHFGTDVLYSDLVVRPENNMTETEHVECYPIPDYVKENGSEEGYYPKSSVVYIRILWKEFEPVRGQYNFSFIEDILTKAKKHEQTVMFRLMPHSTRESDDVPNWVKTLVECPPRPLGKRVKLSPRSPLFLELFGDAIKAFGERFDKDPTLAFVDISLPGAWGEGSSCHLFSEELLLKYVAIFRHVFKHTLLIGQMSEPRFIHDMCNEIPLGARADCIGHPALMREHLPAYIEPIKDLWKTGHISFEAYWWIGEWKRKEWDIDSIIQSTLDWHLSTFNAKSLPIPHEWRDKIEHWVDKMGYHFVIDKAEYEESVRDDRFLSLHLEIDNVGVAPIYYKLPLHIKLKKGEKEFIFTSDTDITQWLPGKHSSDMTLTLPPHMESGEYSISVGIGGKEFPSVVFASNAPVEDDFSVIGNIHIL